MDETTKAEIYALLNGARSGPNAEIIITGDRAAMQWWRNLAGSLAEKLREVVEADDSNVEWECPRCDLAGDRETFTK